MDIDVERLKAVYRHFAQNFKALDAELMAYRTVFHAMKVVLGPEAEKALEVARKSVELQEQMNRKYDAPLEKFLAHIDQVAVHQELEELLQKWSPENPAN